MIVSNGTVVCIFEKKRDPPKIFAGKPPRKQARH